jgi:tRNASer (uridine44-2'-O)-methyltransferase
MPRSKNARDTSRLTGKPLAETLEPASLAFGPEAGEEWMSSPDLMEMGLPFAPEVVYDLNVFLLANPNFNSSCLFRADILFDSLGVLKTPEHEEENSFGGCRVEGSGSGAQTVEPVPARSVARFSLTRTVVRRLIPRNPQLDRPLDQTCHFYEAGENDVQRDAASKRILFVLTPHLSSRDEIPFYHPLLRGLSFLYDFKSDNAEPSQGGHGTLSISFLPFPEPIPDRLDRTLAALLNTQVRLARNSYTSRRPDGGNHNPIKDNVLPKHRVQDTYSWLKLKYAPDLCRRWVEDTEPSKHVFEDLAITAFFIELWRNMYGVAPAAERDGEPSDARNRNNDAAFPGFVDVACGNGVLVYVLLLEGYQGWGFDARRRKSWGIFPDWVQEKLKEAIYIPKPFCDAMAAAGAESEIRELGVDALTGMFPKDTFIISNHADELTVWTPLMAALSNPESPLPFLSIPCCSHSLSGARYRYPPPQRGKRHGGRGKSTPKPDDPVPDEPEQNPQPQTGDLKAFRAEQQASQTDAGMYNSTYGCLTAKTMAIAEEVGYEVERTLMRIPSTRNMGVVGGRRHTAQEWRGSGKPGDSGLAQPPDTHNGDTGNEVVERIDEIVRRECSREWGVDTAAKAWVERAKGLQKGQGRGNQPRH